MSEHHATIHWKKTSASFAYADYNREHEWRFDDGKTVVRASAAPAFKGKPELVDPEEAFVAALSSCHMLTFLALCSRKEIVVESYVDDAVGHLEKNAEGQLVVTRVELRPRIEFAHGQAPEAGALRELHASAHKGCFLANSVKTDVSVAPL
jgi:organic hydroperoxide reductase OsmC/OhrA